MATRQIEKESHPFLLPAPPGTSAGGLIDLLLEKSGEIAWVAATRNAPDQSTFFPPR